MLFRGVLSNFLCDCISVENREELRCGEVEASCRVRLRFRFRVAMAGSSSVVLMSGGIESAVLLFHWRSSAALLHPL